MSLRLERAVFLSFHGVVFFIGVVHIAPPHVVMMRGVFCVQMSCIIAFRLLVLRSINLNEMEKEHLSCYITLENYSRVGSVASETGESIGTVLDFIIEDYFKNQAKESGSRPASSLCR